MTVLCILFLSLFYFINISFVNVYVRLKKKLSSNIFLKTVFEFPKSSRRYSAACLSRVLNGDSFIMEFNTFLGNTFQATYFLTILSLFVKCVGEQIFLAQTIRVLIHVQFYLHKVFESRRINFSIFVTNK